MSLNKASLYDPSGVRGWEIGFTHWADAQG